MDKFVLFRGLGFKILSKIQKSGYHDPLYGILVVIELSLERRKKTHARPIQKQLQFN